nr:AAA+ ATPase domain-containing protein [Tanacetum cinerariifolium]
MPKLTILNLNHLVLMKIHQDQRDPRLNLGIKGEKVVGLIEMTMLMETHEEGEMMEHVDGLILGWMGWERSIGPCSEVEFVVVVEWTSILGSSGSLISKLSCRFIDGFVSAPSTCEPFLAVLSGDLGFLGDTYTKPSIKRQDSFEMRLPELPKIDVHSVQRQASHETDPESTVIPLLTSDPNNERSYLQTFSRPNSQMRIEQYFLMTDYSLWEDIFNRDSPLPTRVIEGVVQPLAPTTAEQRLARKNELKARAIEKRFGGNKETKKVEKTLL